MPQNYKVSKTGRKPQGGCKRKRKKQSEKKTQAHLKTKAIRVKKDYGKEYTKKLNKAIEREMTERMVGNNEKLYILKAETSDKKKETEEVEDDEMKE